DLPYLPYFPYVALPHDPLNNVNDVQQKGPTASLEGLGNQDGNAQGTARLALSSANPGSRHVLAYAVPSPARVTLRIYAANGRLVRTLVDQDAAAGDFRATWDGRDDSGVALAHGVYFAHYTTDGKAADDRKLILE